MISVWCVVTLLGVTDAFLGFNHVKNFVNNMVGKKEPGPTVTAWITVTDQPSSTEMIDPWSAYRTTTTQVAFMERTTTTTDVTTTVLQLTRYLNEPTVTKTVTQPPDPVVRDVMSWMRRNATRLTNLCPILTVSKTVDHFSYVTKHEIRVYTETLRTTQTTTLFTVPSVLNPMTMQSPVFGINGHHPAWPGEPNRYPFGSDGGYPGIAPNQRDRGNANVMDWIRRSGFDMSAAFQNGQLANNGNTPVAGYPLEDKGQRPGAHGYPGYGPLGNGGAVDTSIKNDHRPEGSPYTRDGPRDDKSKGFRIFDNGNGETPGEGLRGWCRCASRDHKKSSRRRTLNREQRSRSRGATRTRQDDGSDDDRPRKRTRMEKRKENVFSSENSESSLRLPSWTTNDNGNGETKKDDYKKWCDANEGGI